jgi:hypothetical protein
LLLFNIWFLFCFFCNNGLQIIISY